MNHTFPLDLLSGGRNLTSLNERVAVDMKRLIDDSNFAKNTVMDMESKKKER